MKNTIIAIVLSIIIVVVGGIMFLRYFIASQPGYVSPSPTVSIEAIATGNPLPKTDVVRLTDPSPGQTITSPLYLKGEARGTWFFEGSFPMVLNDANGKLITQGTAKAAGNWMTSDFVPFTATLTFKMASTVTNRKATLILKKDNPSGLPANDASIEIPVVIK